MERTAIFADDANFFGLGARSEHAEIVSVCGNVRDIGAARECALALDAIEGICIVLETQCLEVRAVAERIASVGDSFVVGIGIVEVAAIEVDGRQRCAASKGHGAYVEGRTGIDG